MATEDVLIRIAAEVRDASRSVAQFVDRAEATLESLERSKVQIPIEVTDAVRRLNTLKAQLQAIESLAGTAKTIRIKGDVSEAAEEVARLEEQISEGLAEALRQAANEGDFTAQQLQEDFESITQRVRRLGGELGRAQADLRQAALAADFDPASESAQRLLARVQRLGREYTEAAEQAGISTARMASGSGRVERSVRELSDAARRAGRDIDRAADRGTQGFSVMERSMEAVRGKLLAVGAAVVSAFAVSRVQEFLKETVSVRLELDRYFQRLKTGTGSQQQANREFERAADLADDLGLNLQATLRGYALLIAATRDQDAAQRGANLTLDQTRELFGSIVIAAAANKASVEDTNLILTAFSQILNKGKLSAEELRQQLGERLPGAQAIFAKALGVSTQRLDKMLARGEILAVDVLPKVSKVLREEFQDAAREAAEGPEASFNRLNNTITTTRANLASGFIDEIAAGAEAGKQKLDELEGAATAAGETLGRVFGKAGSFLSDAIAGLRLLQDLQAAQNIDEVNAATSRLGDTAEQQAERLKGISGALSLLNRIAPGSILLVGKIANALAGEADAAEQTEGALDELSEAEAKANQERERSLIELRKRAQAERDLANELRGNIDAINEQAERLVGAFRIVEAEFADGVIPPELVEEIRDRVEKILEQYARYGVEVPEILTAVAEQVGAMTERQRDALEEQQKILEDLVLNVEDLAERSKVVSLEIASILEGGGPRTAEQAEQIKDVIQDLLDEWAQYGEQPPEHLKAVADAMGITTTTIEKEAEKQRDALKSVADEAQSLAESLRDVTLATPGGEAEAELADLRAEIKRLESQPFLLPEELNRLHQARARVGELQSEMRGLVNANEDAIASTEEVDEVIREFLDGASDDLRRLTDTQRDSIQRALAALQLLGTEGTANAANVADQLGGVADVLKEAGVDASGLERVIDDMQGRGVDLRQAFDELGKPLSEAGDEIETASEALENQVKSVEEIQERVRKLIEVEEDRLKVLSDQADKAERLEKSVGKVHAQMPDLAAEGERLAAALRSACECIGQIAEAL